MDLNLTDEQLMLKDAVTNFMRREVVEGRETNRYWNSYQYDPSLLQTIAQSGWLGMLVPEEYGGAGASVMDCVVLFEGFGSGPLPAPAFSAGVLAPQIVLEGGTETQRATLLPAICGGDMRAALAYPDSGTGWSRESVEMEIWQAGGQMSMSGIKPYVQDGASATTFICAARMSGGTEITLVLVERNQTGVTVIPRHDHLSTVAEVRFDDVQISDGAILGEIGSGWPVLERAIERAIPVLCAFKVGACQRIFDMTVEYTRERIAFGQPIGRFRRVQDHVVELANSMDSARWITYETAWKVDAGHRAKGFVHENKAVASEAYYQVVNQAHKVYAGPGTDLDHPLMAHHVASRVLYQFLGDPTYHKRRMMDELFPLI